MFNEYLAEGAVVKQGIIPQSNLGALTGARFGMEDSSRLAIVISLGATSGAAVDVALQQHDAASAGNSKALAVSNCYYYKADADTSFTKVEVSSDTSDYDLAAIFADVGGIVIFEVLGEDLDVNNGFNHVSANLGAAGVAKIVSSLYLGHAPFKKSAHEVEA